MTPNLEKPVEPSNSLMPPHIGADEIRTPDVTQQAAENTVSPVGESDGVDAELMSDREALLQTLLSPADYAYVKEHKLDELFYRDEASGEDSLRHILTGEVIGNGRFPRGFHHQPSGEALSLEDAEGQMLTRVEQVVDVEGNPIERPLMAPYLAQVVVDGKEKEVLKRQKDGTTTLERGVNSMFPHEYDAFTVIRTIDLAMKSADPRQDSYQKMHNGRWYYNMVGKVPLIDNESEMAVRVVMDFDTMRVVSAYPLMKHSDTMNLTDEQVMHHATYGLAANTGQLAVNAEGVEYHG